MSEPIKNRYEFVMLFDCENGNPNGDPDAGNLPRVDPETGYGILTDVCIKLKIRNYVETVKEGDKNYQIFIKNGDPLVSVENDAFATVGIENAADKKADALKKEIKNKKDEDVDVDGMVKNYLCGHYYDIRTFGAVLTTCVKGALNCGQVRGPVQLTFAKSIDPIMPQEIAITRTAITTQADAEKKSNEMGRKAIIPYGLYRAEGFISANLARKVTGFSEDDLALLWQAIINMFDCDHSAARGKMALRELVVFKHENELGNAPSYKLFDSVSVERIDKTKPARAYSDYKVTVDESAVPNGVSVERMI